MNFVKKTQTNRGIIGILILLIIAVLSISYFGISLKGIVESPTGQSNFGYIKDLSIGLWTHYLEKPSVYLYNDVFLNLIWGPFIKALEDIKAGRPTSIDPAPLNLGQ